MPYQTLGGFRRASRSNSLGYKKLHYHDRDEKQFKRWSNVENFKNLLKTLDKLQEIKYNNIDEWERLKREKATITEINCKTWTLTFKEKAVNNYYELRDCGVEISSHGGARQTENNDFYPSFTFRVHENSLEKKKIALSAIKLIKNGDLIFLDGTTFSFFIAEYLSEFENIRVITNGIDTLSMLAK